VGRIFLLFTAGMALGQTGPAITQDLTNQTGVYQGSVSFTVGVSGTGPFTYQWQVNGSNRNIISTVAGTGTAAYTGDGGLATSACLSYPSGIAIDTHGNLFIADSQNNRLREVNTNGIITSVAGIETAGFSGDGSAATNAMLNYPYSVAVDAYGNLFIADSGNGRIRMVDTNGVITTIAGGGTQNPGDGGAATNASISVVGVAVDSLGNVFIADIDNNRIREVGTNGIITTVAGNGTPAYSGDASAATNASLSMPRGVAIDSLGDLFIADFGNSRIREVDTNGIITTVAGDGTFGYFGDGGAATNAELEFFGGVTVDVAGDLFIPDSYNNRLREVGTNGIIITFAGNGGGADSGDGGLATNASLNFPYASAVGAYGNVFIVDNEGQRVREVEVDDEPTLTINNLTAGDAGSYDVVITSPYGSVTSSVVTLTVLSPPVLTAQPASQRALLGSNVTFGVTLTGSIPLSYQWFFDGAALPGQTTNNLLLAAVNFTNAGSYQVVVTNLYGAATSGVATLTVISPPVLTAQPQSQMILSGNNATLSVAVSGIGPFTYQWQFHGTNLPNGIISTVAGGGTGGDGVLAINAGLNNPSGVAVDVYDNLYVADTYYGRIREVAVDGIITTVAGSSRVGFSGDGGAATNAWLNDPYGLALDTLGNLFIADTGNNRIREVGANGIITTVAGDTNSGYGGDGGAATNTSLNQPRSVVVDVNGNLFIADTSNQRIREVTNGIIMTVAGGGTNSPGDGGAATNARVSSPAGVAVDAFGNLLIADASSGRIRAVDGNGTITTLAGGGHNYPGDGGPATNAVLSQPYGIAVDGIGNVFVADAGANLIRKVSTNGIIATVAGKSGSSGYAGDGGPATNATLSRPSGVAVDAYGHLFIADSGNNRIREVNFQGPTFLVRNVNSNNAGNYDVVITGPHGSVTSSVVTITQVFGPGILTPPQSQAAQAGVAVTFSVIASSTGPFSYQWFYNGASMSGQTSNTLVLSNVSSNNAGAYRVVVANPYASVTSSVAALSIVTPTLQPPSQTVVAGSSATLSVTVSGSGPLSYQWQCNGTNLPTSTISTLAGKGTAGYSGDGSAATNALLHGPRCVCVDGFGNVVIADTGNNRIREIGTNGIITTVAGGGKGGDGGAATNASLNGPGGVTVDACGNLFIADTGDCRIRKVGNNGIITTVAGNGWYSYEGDGGLATNTGLGYPSGVAVDASGNLFIADDLYRIRKVGTNGLITTMAGTGISGNLGDGGTATGAYLFEPFSIAMDAYGNFFITDTGHNRIREVAGNGLINTVAGSYGQGYYGDGGIATRAF